MAKTSTVGFYKAPSVSKVPDTVQEHDDAAYEWDESPSKKQVPAPRTEPKMGGTTQNFYKPAPAKKNFLMAADDGDLEDWDDGIELKKPVKKVEVPKKRAPEPAPVDDTLDFMNKAALERKQLATKAEAAANVHQKTIAELQYKTTGAHVEVDQFQPGGPMQAQQVSPMDTAAIKQLLFKSQTGSFHDSWQQGFYLDPKLKYGLFQDKGGPCGIIATVNAFYLKHLLYGHKRKLDDSSVFKECLASAITDVLLNASNGNQVCLAVPKSMLKGQVSINSCHYYSMPASRK